MTYASDDLRSSLRNIKFGQTDIAEERQRDGYTNHKERVLRVLSWLSAAEKYKEKEDYDVSLMCALAAFNGLYAKAVPLQQRSDKHKKKHEEDYIIINEMIAKLITHDKGGKDGILLEYLKNEGRDEFKEILANQYLYFSFWKYSDYGHEEFNKRNQKIKKFLAECSVVEPLQEVMHRIRELRNQLMHGEAGYEDHYNRWQVIVCANFLPPLVGRMLSIMIYNKHFFRDKVPCPPQTEPNKRVDKFTSLESESGQNEKK